MILTNAGPLVAMFDRLIHATLQALIRQFTKKDLNDLAGKIQLRDDFDHKKLRELSRATS